MCFSAAASFSTAAITGTVGFMTLSKAANLRELPLAAAPLIFGLQQALEGVIWLTVSRTGAVPYVGRVVDLFLIIALILWPILVPAAVGLVESRSQRQMIIYALLLPALGMALYGAHDIATHNFSVQAVQHTLCYVNAAPYPPIMMAGYILCTCGPLIIASDLILRLLGLIVGLGLVIAGSLFFLSFVSVWCFFAAIGSAVIYLYFYRRTASRLSLLTKAAD